MVAIVLVHPEIPPNTGNVIRLTANTATELHLVEPLGFRMDDRELKRAGLDYHEYARVARASRLGRLPRGARRGPPRRWFALTTQRARARSTTARFAPGDVLVFGCETAGLPDAILARVRARCAAAHSDAAGRAQPQPVERGRGRRLRSVAAAGVCRRR